MVHDDEWLDLEEEMHPTEEIVEEEMGKVAELGLRTIVGFSTQGRSRFAVPFRIERL